MCARIGARRTNSRHDHRTGCSPPATHSRHRSGSGGRWSSRPRASAVAARAWCRPMAPWPGRSDQTRAEFGHGETNGPAKPGRWGTGRRGLGSARSLRSERTEATAWRCGGRVTPGLARHPHRTVPGSGAQHRFRTAFRVESSPPIFGHFPGPWRARAGRRGRATARGPPGAPPAAACPARPDRASRQGRGRPARAPTSSEPGCVPPPCRCPPSWPRRPGRVATIRAPACAAASAPAPRARPRHRHDRHRPGRRRGRR